MCKGLFFVCSRLIRIWVTHRSQDCPGKSEAALQMAAGFWKKPGLSATDFTSWGAMPDQEKLGSGCEVAAPKPGGGPK